MILSDKVDIRNRTTHKLKTDSAADQIESGYIHVLQCEMPDRRCTALCAGCASEKAGTHRCFTGNLKI